MIESAAQVEIRSRDYWFKVVEFLQTNWALIDETDEGVMVWFFGDTSGVFDEMEFPSEDAAIRALKRNGFARYAEDPKAQEFIGKPEPPFYRHPHPNGQIYSSGRFWK
jgi:hypothetical protein